MELVLLKGKTHLTKAEIEARRQAEVDAPADGIRAPDFLTKKQAEEFEQIARQLADLGIMTNLDCDVLGMYLVARDDWIRAGKDYDEVRRAASPQRGLWLEDGVSDMVKLSGIRDRAFKQAMKCACELGLTITSRCRLVVPKKEEPPANKFARFGAG